MPLYTDTDYATLPEFKERVNVPSTEASHDTMLQQLLNTSAWMVDQLTRKPPDGKVAFSKVTAETRYYDDSRDGVIPIDDLLTLTSVTRDNSTLVENTDFVLEPYNAYPKVRIVFNNLGLGNMHDPVRTFTAARAVKVVGDWGYCSATDRPPVIKEATLLQAEKLYEHIGTSKEMLAQAVSDPWKVADKVVQAILMPLMKKGYR